MRFRLQNFDHVAIVQNCAQRNMAAIDLCPHSTVAKISVHRIGEINRGGAFGQLVQHTLGCEGKDAILIHRHPGVFQQLFWIVAGFQNFDQVPQPTCLSIGRIILFIGPMGGQAIFGGLMHVRASYLHLDPHILCEHDGGMD